MTVPEDVPLPGLEPAEPPAEPEPRLALSYSRLSRYQRCPESFRLQYIKQVPMSKGGAVIAGSAVHEALEAVALEGTWKDAHELKDLSEALFMEPFDRMVAEAGGPGELEWGGRKRILRDEQGHEILDEHGNKVKTGEDYRWWGKTGPLMVRRGGSVLRRDQDHGVRVVDPSVEMKVSAWLDHPGGVKVTGVIDLMMLVDEDGQRIIRDWKTGTYIDPLQLAGYAWLLRNMPNPEQRIVADVGQIGYLRGTKPETWIRTYELEQWVPLLPVFFRQQAESVERQLGDDGDADQPWEYRPSSFCGSCWVRDHCAYGRTLREDE